MPASPTRICPLCKKEKRTAIDFRDRGDVNVGRPPKVCAECRAKSPVEQAKQAANVAFRKQNVDNHVLYASRSYEEVLRDRARIHPGGLKTCPENSGCGKSLPLSEFAEDWYQAAGLDSVCRSCRSGADSLRHR